MEITDENGTSKKTHTDQNLWVSHVRFILARNMTRYINYYLQEKTELPYNQNTLEQIYIPKDNNYYKSFDNARPITKTSPIYKLIDTILDLRLK